MKKVIKTLGLLSIIAVIPGAMAATSRVSMISKASPRLPSIAGYIMANSNTAKAASTSKVSYLADPDCLSNYTDCIKGADACGSEFEECTTNVLLHAKMPVCLSVLAQCSASGIASLFGTSDLSAITTPIKNSDGDITGYTYPSAGSALEQMVTGAQIENTFTKEECVRKYTSCLNRDTVCGDDFELCTDNNEFKKQAISCDSTLARCKSDGKAELFGSAAEAAALTPSKDSRLGGMIQNGAELAAINAVKTCQRVTDNCLVSACLANPWRCVEGTSMKKISAADFIAGGTTDENTKTSKITVKASDYDLMALTGGDIRKNLKAQCLETIGANKYCHMTYREKSPKNKELLDIDLQEDVFSLAYAARKEMINTKIQEELKSFDTKAKEACINTITSCAMRSCGGGIGSVCYTQARTTNGVEINGSKTYNDIKSGCGAIVNTDPNCQYAATAETDEGYVYGYNQDVFDKLFTASSVTVNADPIGVIASLNSLLATSYNDGAIENMKKQCRTTALACVKSMCGKDYENCYRNRTDIVDGTYNTGTSLDKSMNKMGGILDYNIVIGLCMNTVQSSSVCEEHLKIAADAAIHSQADAKSWGAKGTYDSVRSAWDKANTTGATATEYNDVIVACRVGSKNKSDTCGEWDEMPLSENGDCNGVMDDAGCIYSEPVTQSYTEFTINNAGTTLFQELLRDVEKEVQAKYNAKLTKEQNVCLAQNNGGIMGAGDNGSTFMWVKLNGNKIPKNYNMQGLTAKQFKASNDLYGSFCRARITVTSDDKDIQNMLGEKATAYFAVGDSFTCGSWIDDKDMAKITEKVGQRKLCAEGYGTWDTKKGECSGTSTKEKIAYAWATVGGALGGGAIGTALTESGVLGGLLNKANQKNTDKSTQKQDKKLCISYANSAKTNATGENVNATAVSYLESASSICNDVVATNRTSACDIKDEEKGSNEKIVAAANRIKDACENASDTKTGWKDENSAKAARIAVPIATTVAGGALGLGITASVIQAKKEEIKNKAVAEWMQEVGDHIQCYLGADELGSYGDVISFTIE